MYYSDYYSPYTYSSTHDYSNPFEWITLLVWVLVIISFIGSIIATSMLIKVGRSKGHAIENAGFLWFIGLFVPLGIIVVGLYVNALPDNNHDKKDDPQLPEL